MQPQPLPLCVVRLLGIAHAAISSRFYFLAVFSVTHGKSKWLRVGNGSKIVLFRPNRREICVACAATRSSRRKSGGTAVRRRKHLLSGSAPKPAPVRNGAPRKERPSGMMAVRKGHFLPKTCAEKKIYPVPGGPRRSQPVRRGTTLVASPEGSSCPQRRIGILPVHSLPPFRAPHCRGWHGRPADPPSSGWCPTGWSFVSFFSFGEIRLSPLATWRLGCEPPLSRRSVRAKADRASRLGPRAPRAYGARPKDPLVTIQQCNPLTSFEFPAPSYAAIPGNTRQYAGDRPFFCRVLPRNHPPIAT
jgi:hypothetical protein